MQRARARSREPGAKADSRFFLITSEKFLLLVAKGIVPILKEQHELGIPNWDESCSAREVSSLR